MHTFHWEQNSVLKTEMVFDEAEGRKMQSWNSDVTLAFREFLFFFFLNNCRLIILALEIPDR